MNEFILLYIYTMLLTLETILLFCIPIILVVLVFALINKNDCRNDQELEQANKFLRMFKSKTFITAVILSLALIIAVPSKDDLITIVGGGVVIKTTQVDGIDKLPKNLVNAANSFLEQLEKKQ